MPNWRQRTCTMSTSWRLHAAINAMTITTTSSTQTRSYTKLRPYAPHPQTRAETPIESAPISTTSATKVYLFLVLSTMFGYYIVPGEQKRKVLRYLYLNPLAVLVKQASNVIAPAAVNADRFFHNHNRVLSYTRWHIILVI